MLRSVSLMVALCASFSTVFGGERVVTLRLLDPRVVTNTRDTFTTSYRGRRTDVIAKRVLTVSEAQRIDALVTQELVDDDDVPMCSHYPAYAITVEREGTKTICGLCMTWAEKDKLRVIKGKRLLKYLESLLPLPDYFAKSENLEDLVMFPDNRETPFHQLSVKHDEP
ncbi:MAG: hypothetical protein AAF802_31900 [Planctomycetota bacterium]